MNLKKKKMVRQIHKLNNYRTFGMSLLLQQEVNQSPVSHRPHLSSSSFVFIPWLLENILYSLRVNQTQKTVVCNHGRFS